MSGPAAASRDPSINRRIFRATVTIALGSMLPKLGLVGRDVVIAAEFGVADQVDAYLVALLIPSMMAQILAQSYAAALVPAVMRRREERGAEAGAEFAARALGLGLVILALFVIALWLLGPLLIALAGPGFSSPKRALAGTYLGWLMPVALFQGAAILWGALLNSRERFAAVSVLPAVTPALCIAVLVSPLGANGMEAVAIATLVGAIIEAALLVLIGNRAGMKLPRLGRDREFRHLWRQSAPLALGLVFANGGLLVDQLCASLAGSGGVSTLGYGNKLAGMLVAVAAAPLSVAVLPYFSSLAARDDVGGMRRTLRYWSIVVAVASAPVALGVIFLSEPIVRLLFERGSFTAANTTAVFPVQQLSLLQLPFYLLGTLGSRMLNALRMNNSLLLIAAFNFVVNGALDLGLLHLMGVPGIALAKSIVSAISSVLVFRAVDRRLTIQPLPALQR